MVKIGLQIEGEFGLTWTRWQRLVQATEQLGYARLFCSDHIIIGNAPPGKPPGAEVPAADSLEAWVALTYAASTTERIEIGPAVSPVTFRHPCVTARMASAVDDLSRGRLVLGLGTGWLEIEHRRYGIPFYDVNTRFEMLRDALGITTALFHNNHPVSYRGKHFSIQEAVLLPRPQRLGGPPIMIGGLGAKRTLLLAAKYADEWNGAGVSPDQFRERCLRLDEMIFKAGRRPEHVKRSLFAFNVIFSENEAALRAKIDMNQGLAEHLRQPSTIGGTPTQIIDQIGRYIEAGVEYFVLQWMDMDDIDGLEKMAATVLPHFH